MNILDKVHFSWYPILGYLKERELEHLNYEILPNISYQPKKEHIFRAFEQPLDAIKLTILGQDPYPTPGNAIGYAFAVPQNRKKPKSLQIIEEEIKKSDILNMNRSGELDMLSWPEQGVLLLNTALTVETGKPGSHTQYWKPFIERVIRFISSNRPCMWLLWGNNAKSFEKDISQERLIVNGHNRDTIESIPLNEDWNYVMKSPHPMVEAYKGTGFYGRDHFYFVNRILALQGRKTIVW